MVVSLFAKQLEVYHFFLKLEFAVKFKFHKFKSHGNFVMKLEYHKKWDDKFVSYFFKKLKFFKIKLHGKFEFHKFKFHKFKFKKCDKLLNILSNNDICPF